MRLQIPYKKASLTMPAKRSYSKRLSPKRGQAKVAVVMKEFKKKKLKSSSGRPVSSRKQAVAIALSEAELSKKKKKSKRGR